MLCWQSCGAAPRVASWISPPHLSFMDTSDSGRFACCKGSPRDCWGRDLSREDLQRRHWVLFCHFVIAFGAATVYFAMSRGVRFLVDHAVLSGVLYGVAVYFFMNRIVVPLSAARKYPFSFKMMVIGVIIHMFCVGLPISLSVRRYSVH